MILRKGRRIRNERKKRLIKVQCKRLGRRDQIGIMQDNVWMMKEELRMLRCFEMSTSRMNTEFEVTTDRIGTVNEASRRRVQHDADRSTSVTRMSSWRRRGVYRLSMPS